MQVFLNVLNTSRMVVFTIQVHVLLLYKLCVNEETNKNRHTYRSIDRKIDREQSLKIFLKNPLARKRVICVIKFKCVQIMMEPHLGPILFFLYSI